MNGKSGKTNNRIFGRNGNNYPGSLLSVHSVLRLCTRPVVSGVTARPGRPNGAVNRIRPPVTTQVRRGREEPSVAASSHTVSKSMSATVGEKSAPPSVDHPKLLSTPFQYTSAQGVAGKGIKDQERVWCYPGRGAPDAPCAGQALPASVGDVLVSRNEKRNHATRQRVRVPIEPKLSKIVEKQNRDIDPEVVVTAHASSTNLPALNTGKQSAKIISNL